jgi:hypothetical protein
VVIWGGLFATASAQGALTTFAYTQSDTTTGSGTIQGFSYDPGDGGGPITFSATPLPSAVVVNPNPGLTPSGFVGAITGQTNNGNESNAAVGLTFSGSVTANGTRGGQNYTIQIPLRFVPKQTQTPDASDYTWNVNYGDDAAGGTDTVTSAAVRLAFYLGRDTTIDANAETSNLFQRYTQDNKSFVVGPDTFSNTNTTTAAIKDAEDPAGNPTGTDAAGRDLGFYFGWRDTGGLTSGAILVNDFTIGGLVNADEATLSPPVPEPSALGLLAAAALVGLRRGRR